MSGFFWAKSASGGIGGLTSVRIPKLQKISLLFLDLSNSAVAHGDPSALTEMQQLSPGPAET